MSRASIENDLVVDGGCIFFLCLENLEDLLVSQLNWQQAIAFVDVSLRLSLESLGRIKVYQSTV